jgi:hypothetical protein
MIDLIVMMLLPMIIGIFGVVMIFMIVYNDEVQRFLKLRANKKAAEDVMATTDHEIVNVAMQSIIDLPIMEDTEKAYDVEEVARAVINSVWTPIEADVRYNMVDRISHHREMILIDPDNYDPYKQGMKDAYDIVEQVVKHE